VGDWQFQSAPPVRAAAVMGRGQGGRLAVSIRAAREGGGARTYTQPIFSTIQSTSANLPHWGQSCGFIF